MSIVDIRALATEADDLLRRVDEDGETIQIMRRGRVAALLVKSPETEHDADEDPSAVEIEAAIARFDRLTEEVANVWPQGVSALDAIDDVRRDL